MRYAHTHTWPDTRQPKEFIHWNSWDSSSFSTEEKYIIVLMNLLSSRALSDQGFLCRSCSIVWRTPAFNQWDLHLQFVDSCKSPHDGGGVVLSLWVAVTSMDWDRFDVGGPSHTIIHCEPGNRPTKKKKKSLASCHSQVYMLATLHLHELSHDLPGTKRWTTCDLTIQILLVS